MTGASAMSSALRVSIILALSEPINCISILKNNHSCAARPGGIRQQFKAGQPMVESLLRSLKKDEALQGPLSARILDQGDAVGAWTSPRLAAILFPTPETLKQACTCGQMPCDSCAQ